MVIIPGFNLHRTHQLTKPEFWSLKKWGKLGGEEKWGEMGNPRGATTTGPEATPPPPPPPELSVKTCVAGGGIGSLAGGGGGAVRNPLLSHAYLKGVS